MSDQLNFLNRVCGAWSGVMRTYFEPDVLADESPVEATIRPVLDGSFWQHNYAGTVSGTPLSGQALYAYNTFARRYEAAWIDTFHTGSGILFSTGERDAPDFSVLTHYPDPAGGPPWGWRTTLALDDRGTLWVRMYNVPPEGDEALAVEMECVPQTRERADA